MQCTHPAVLSTFSMVVDGPTSKQEFELALDKVIVQAYRNGVSLDNGGYILRHNSSDIPDLELMIYRLAETPTDTE